MVQQGMVQQDQAEQDHTAQDQTEEKEEAPSAPDDADRVGSKYIDNPQWLTKKMAAEEKARSTATEEETSVEPDRPGYLPGYRRQLGVGLSPSAPQMGAVLPATTTPSMGAREPSEGFTFGFHGYLQGGLRAGIGSRENALEGQQSTTFHGDPLVPGAAYGWFEHTMTVPTPWAQLNFDFGNDVVRATAILGAWSLSEADEASGYFQGPSQLGFNNAFLTFTPKTGPVGVEVNAGVFSERYGAMGQNDAGAYGVSLIAAIYGMGATATVTLPFENEVTITSEAGFKSDLNTPPVGLAADQSNEMARPVEGSTYAAHGHLSFDFNRSLEITGHAIHTFSQDDRGDELEGRDVFLGDQPRKDGSLSILGLDSRVRLQRFGHLYLGGSHVVGRNTITVANLVQVLNNGPGRDLAERYWSFESGGNGTLTLAGAEYSVSLGTLLRHPVPFHGIGPDLTVSTFGIFARQTSAQAEYDNVNRLKAGTELTYSMLPWLALAGRADIVMPNLDQQGDHFGVLSPQLIFRTDWDSRATLTAQYSAYLLGEDVVVNGDNRLLNNPSGEPDRHMLALFGTFWW
jgi:hypothetical protein